MQRKTFYISNFNQGNQDKKLNSAWYFRSLLTSTTHSSNGRSFLSPAILCQLPYSACFTA